MIKIKIIYNQGIKNGKSVVRTVEEITTNKKITISKTKAYSKFRDITPRTAIYLEIGNFEDEDFSSRLLFNNKIYIEEIK